MHQAINSDPAVLAALYDVHVFFEVCARLPVVYCKKKAGPEHDQRCTASPYYYEVPPPEDITWAQAGAIKYIQVERLLEMWGLYSKIKCLHTRLTEFFIRKHKPDLLLFVDNVELCHIWGHDNEDHDIATYLMHVEAATSYLKIPCNLLWYTNNNTPKLLALFIMLTHP